MVVVLAVVALGVAGCGPAGTSGDVADSPPASRATSPGTAPGGGTPGRPGAATGTSDGAGVEAGAAACEDALREGPLIDPDDSDLGEPPPGVEPLPLVSLPRLDTCEPTSTRDWLGRPLVVNFWASWCGPCREEMPELDHYAGEHAGEVDLVGVTIDFRREDAIEFLGEVPVGFPSWFDPDAQVLGRQVSVRSMPTTLFVAPDGTIVHRHVGPITQQELRDAASEHLGV